MPRIPGIHHKDAVRVFEKLGFVVKRQGGHIVMSNGKIRPASDVKREFNSITFALLRLTKIRCADDDALIQAEGLQV